MTDVTAAEPRVVAEGVDPAAPAAVRLSRIVKTFPDNLGLPPVLEDVSLSVAPGEFVCLLGASGCGKSTLLSLIAGLEQPSAGTIAVDGRPGLMFQESALFPWLSAGRNVELALRLRGVARQERRGEAEALLERVNLTGIYDKRIHELSGGMRQRVALARALAQESSVLLMDEPFAALDAITRDVLHDELTRVWSELKPSIVFVTHNVREAARLGQRVLLMSSRPGRFVREWHVDIAQPRRIDSPEVSRLAAEITDDLRREIRRHAGERSSRTQAELLRESKAVESGLDALGTATATARTPVWRRVLGSALPPVVALALVVLVWQLVYVSGVKPSYVIPSPSMVWDAFTEQWRAGTVQDAVATSVRRALLGFAISVVVAVPLGLLVARFRLVRTAIGPLLTGLQTLPSVAWVPFAIILFGLDDATIYTVVLLGAVPSIANGLIAGIDQTPPIYNRVGHVLGARRLSMVRHVLIPAAFPGFLAGLKQGWAFSWRSLMAAELIVRSQALGIGLGQLLDQGRQLSDMTLVILTIILILFVGIAVELLLFAPMERRMLRSRGLSGARR